MLLYRDWRGIKKLLYTAFGVQNEYPTLSYSFEGMDREQQTPSFTGTKGEYLYKAEEESQRGAEA